MMSFSLQTCVHLRPTAQNCKDQPACQGLATPSRTVRSRSTAHLPGRRAAFCKGTPLAARPGVPTRSSRSLQVTAAAGSLEGNLGKEAHSLRRTGWLSFWAQLALSVVSATILSFAVTSSMQSPGGINVSVWFTLFGVASSFISTFFAFSYVKLARQSFSNGDVSREAVSARLLTNNSLNLWGLGATLLGLQAVIGGLVAKTLTTSSTNPYAQGGAGARAAPVALDVFSVQASANTLLAHFVSIVFTNILLRTLNKATPDPKTAY